MHILPALLLFVWLPRCLTLNCYVCSAGSNGCNDPFNATGADVSQSGANATNTYCIKTDLFGTVTRGGQQSCVPTGFILNTGIACCQTDLCNGAATSYPFYVLLVVSLMIIFRTMK